jgi:DNA-binding NtrC family response regulator
LLFNDQQGLKGKSVKKNFTILIADRNPHVRTFLQREMTAIGYRVRLADNGREVLKWAFQGEPLDLIILDPDFFDTDQTALLKRLQNRIPMLPVVIHSFQSDDAPYLFGSGNMIFVEKREDSVEHLKQIANEILKSSC